MSEFIYGDGAVRRVADDKIRAAVEAGAFDNLPGAGEPIPDLDMPYDAQWWVRRWIQRERLTDEMREHGPERAVATAAIRELIDGMRDA